MAKAKHSTTYALVKRLIDMGKTDGLADKIDLYEAAGRFLEGEYAELIEMLKGEE